MLFLFGSASAQSDTLYQANFNADVASDGSNGSSPDSWSAIHSGGATGIGEFAPLNSGDYYFIYQTGADQNFSYSCTWTSDSIAIANYSGFVVSIYTAASVSGNAAWTATLTASNGTLNSAPSVSLSQGDGGLQSFIFTPDDVGQSSTLLTIQLNYTKKNTFFLVDDVVLRGDLVCPDEDGDGLCDDADGCTDVLACNYTDPAAVACLFDDACGVCDGPGAIYECGCSDIPVGDCDCNGNQLDALGVCGGSCAVDADGDGVCDDVDPCVGTVDACGVCNGPGAVFECGCADIPVGDCDCDGNQEDALGVCGGTCAADVDGDGICDDVDTCIGAEDACGVCGGNGTTWSVATSALAGGFYQEFTLSAMSMSAIGTVEVELSGTGGDGNNWASDLLVALVDPNGNGVEWGGDNITTFNAGYAAGPGWPTTGWNEGIAASSPFSASVDLSSYNLNGNGTWSLLVGNGYNGAGNVAYLVSVQFDELCQDTPGCTDPSACNYDPEALVDDGTCSFVPGGDCTCVSTLFSTETLSGAGLGSPVTVNASGTLGDLGITLDYTGAGDSWPADLLLAVTSPSGACTEFGGFTSGITAGCDPLTVNNQWPASWISPASGTYVATIDLSESGLYGDGDWTIQLINGYDASDDVTYDASISLWGICTGGPIVGCTDVTACNYDPDATSDDGSCAVLDFCGICGGDGTGCGDGGCTDSLSCNYDSTAVFDDGSCLPIDDPVVGCCSYTVGTPVDLAGNQSYAWNVEASSVNGLGLFEISMNFSPTGSNRNWASDLVVVFENPAGDCLWFGGNQYTELPSNWFGCEQLPGIWPEGWNTNVPGSYTATVDLSSSSLTGIGTWTVTIQNGDLQTSPADYTFLTWTAQGLCYVDGCMTEGACNYTPLATEQVNADCVFADGPCESCNSDGTVADNDADNDGICDADEVPGCTDALACNYEALATDEDGSCDFCSCAEFDIVSDNAAYGVDIEVVNSNIGVLSDGTNLIGYQTYRVYLTVPNATDFLTAVSGDASNPTHISTTSSFYQSPLGASTPNGINPLVVDAFPELGFDSWVTIGLTGQPDGGNGEANVQTVQSIGNPWETNFDPGGGSPGGNIVIDDAVGGSWFALNGNTNAVAGSDLKVLVGQFTTDGSLSGEVFATVIPEGNFGLGQEESVTVSFSQSASGNACGCTDALADNYDSEALYDDGGCQYLGCTNEAASNYDAAANVDDGSCLIEGCTDPEADNYNPEATVPAFCIYSGCTNEAATNYDPQANVDDGSCLVEGCTDGSPFGVDGTPPACNYDPEANVDDGSCEYLTCAGCIEQSACNYDSTALIDDGSCDYSCQGCTDPCASNFDPSATVDNGTCDNSHEVGCTDETACNYDTCAVFLLASTCTYPVDETTLSNALNGLSSLELPVNANGILVLSSLDSLLGLEAGCEPVEYTFEVDDCFGSEDIASLVEGNYVVNVTAATGNASVSNPVALTALPFAPEGANVCTDAAACNYNAAGACYFAGDPCPEGGAPGGEALVAVALSDGTGCTCEPVMGTQLWFESFDADGAAALDGLVVSAGDGYDLDAGTLSGLDLTEPTTNTQWTLDGIDGVSSSAEGAWSVQGMAGDLYFEGFQLQDNVMGWRTYPIATSGYSKVRLEADLGESGAGMGDYIQAVLQTQSGDSLTGFQQEGNLPAAAEWEQNRSQVVDAPDLVVVDIDALCGSEGEAVRFDDVAVYGWTGGCRDVQASNYSPLAQFDDGSCQYDWTILYAARSGFHTDRLWFPSTQASDLEAMRQAVKVPWDVEKTVVVQSGVSLRIDEAQAVNGVVQLGGLQIESDAAVYVPEGVTLELMDALDVALLDAIDGPGRVCPSGGWDWSAVAAEDTIRITNLAVTAEASLIVPEGQTLEVAGDLDFPAEETAKLSGTVLLGGAGEQQISGQSPTFDRLIVDPCVNSGGFVNVVADSLVVAGRLSILSGDVYLQDNVLIFSSDTSGTGLLDAVPIGSSLAKTSISEVPVQAETQRYIAPDDDGVSNMGYTLFSASGIDGAVVSDLNGIEGYTSAGWPTSDNPNNSSNLLFWDETNRLFVSPGGDQTPLDTLGGCLLFLESSQAPTMNFKGPIRDHRVGEEVGYPLTRSLTSEESQGASISMVAGLNSIPNPYQARLDWSAIYNRNSDIIEDHVMIWDTQDRILRSWSSQFDSLQNNGSRFIEPGNAFLVKLSPGNTTGTLFIPTSAIDNDAQGGPYVRQEGEGDILIALENAFGTGYVKVQRSEGGQSGYLHGTDITYASFGSALHGQLAIRSNQVLYSAKTLPLDWEGEVWLRTLPNWPTTMSVVQAPEGLCARVVDTHSGMAMPLEVGEEMTFTLSQAEAEAGRFMLEMRPWAEAEGRMPSCPEALDGEIEVEFGQGVTAHVALTTPEGTVLDQHMEAMESTSFSAAPGDYQVVVTPVAGTFCPKRHREVVVPPGEEPELLGLDWSAPMCNEGTAEVGFELYGGGTFGWTLWNEEGDIQEQGAGHGEVALAGLPPAEYVLDIEHPCLSELRDIPALDAEAPVAEAVYPDVLVQQTEGEVVTWSALCTTPDVSGCSWWVDGQHVSDEPAMEWSTTEVGLHTALLRVERNGCAHETTLTFEVAATMKAEGSAQWSVAQMLDHWSIRMPTGAGQHGRWRLLDGRGRMVQEGLVGDNPSVRVDYPATQGAYFLALITSEFKDVKCVFAP